MFDSPPMEMEVDGDWYKSWPWWLDALQAMRRTYSIPMDAKEARIRAEVAEARTRETVEALRLEALTKGRLMKRLSGTCDPEALRAAAEEARGEDRPRDELVAVRRWAKTTKDPEAAKYQKQLDDERFKMYLVMQKEETSLGEEEDWSEPCMYRRKWQYLHAGRHNTYEDTTDIPAMRFTDVEPDPRDWKTAPNRTLQIFSFKVAAIANELRWPLDVYGLIAIRDHLDRKRNIIYAHSRDNCQTITSEDPYLTLVGPTRAAVLSNISNSVRFEVVLKVKSGDNESEDKDLSLLASKYRTFETNYSRAVSQVVASKLSKLEWRFGLLAKSVEATISIKVIHGSWPNGRRGIFSASTISLDGMKVLLLSLEDDKLPVNIDGMINLSRHVVSVEIEGGLKISIATEYTEGEQVTTAKDETIFTPRQAGRSCAILKVHTCEMEVIAVWSRLFPHIDL